MAEDAVSESDPTVADQADPEQPDPEQADPEQADDASSHIDPVVAHLAEKFPQAGTDHVSDVVWEIYHRLSAEARVTEHLPALTQRHAQETLQAEADAAHS